MTITGSSSLLPPASRFSATLGSPSTSSTGAGRYASPFRSHGSACCLTYAMGPYRFASCSAAVSPSSGTPDDVDGAGAAATGETPMTSVTPINASRQNDLHTAEEGHRDISHLSSFRYGYQDAPFVTYPGRNSIPEVRHHPSAFTQRRAVERCQAMLPGG